MVTALGALFLFSLVRLQENITRFGTDGAQIDFSVYYTAGQSLNAGFSPYKNGIVLDPPIWDGAARYIHSRFIYPPLFAAPFAFVAKLMPYATAKFFWMYFSLACLLASIILTIRTLKLRLRFWQYVVLGIYAACFFPLLASLLLGQIDAVTLLIAVIAITLTTSSTPREMTAGALWAFAALIKLHIGFVALFFILRKQRKLLLGFLVGGIAIYILTILFTGTGTFENYAVHEFPRIAQYGDSGTSEMKLPASFFEDDHNKNTPDALSINLEKSGHSFKGVHLSFAPNASLARFIVMRIGDVDKDVRIPVALTSLILMALILPLAYMSLRKIKATTAALSPDKEFLYWYAILMVIMLIGPLTWAMNVIWLIPLAALAVGRNPWSSDRMKMLPWLLLVVALVLAFVPDCMYYGWRDFANPSWACKALDSSKYIFAEILIIISVWFQIKNDPPTDHKPAKAANSANQSMR